MWREKREVTLVVGPLMFDLILIRPKFDQYYEGTLEHSLAFLSTHGKCIVSGSKVFFELVLLHLAL